MIHFYNGVYMGQTVDNPLSYEHIRWDRYDQNGQIASKTEEILNHIPHDVESILDIGCGNGLITNRLAQKYDVVGVDRCQTALKFVETKKIMASSNQISVLDRSFDMVFSSELLEHLDNQVLSSTVCEMKRISKKYIFITIPNNETVETASYQCPHCDHIFNEFNHIRSFDVKKVQQLFSGYILEACLEYGPPKRGYHPLLLKFRQKFIPPASWMPSYRTGCKEKDVLCPRCEIQFHYKYKFHFLGLCCDLLNVILMSHKPYWLLMLFSEKQDR